MLAETVACILFVPIDVIKERLQVQSSLGTYYYKNSIEAFQKIIANEGFFGIYRAYGATVMSFGPCSAINLMTYDLLKCKFLFLIKLTIN